MKALVTHSFIDFHCYFHGEVSKSEKALIEIGYGFKESWSTSFLQCFKYRSSPQS